MPPDPHSYYLVVFHDAPDVRVSKALGVVNEHRRVSHRAGTIRSAAAIPAGDGGALLPASTSPLSGALPNN
jgi:hypothetical protein